MGSRDPIMSGKHSANQHSLSYLTQMNNSDLDIVRKALVHVHHSQLHDNEVHDKNQFLCMREVLPGGSSVLIEACLKQLLVVLNKSADKFDGKLSDDLEGKSIMSAIADHSDAHEQGIRVPAYRMKSQIPSVIPSLLSRDLRRMDFVSHPNEEPSIRVRKHVVLFSVDPIRAIIMSSRIIILVPPGGMDQILKIVETYMEGWTKEQKHFAHSADIGHITFESHAYEAILSTMNSLNSHEYKLVNAEAEDVLSYFNTKQSAILPYTIQEKMRRLKNAVFHLQSRISSLHKALSVLIDDDESMAFMNLTKLKKDPGLYRVPMSQDFIRSHEEIEEVLEHYLKDCNTLLEKSNYLVVSIQNAEDLMALRLDTSRNELLVVNTRLVVYMVAVGFSAYITGIYGMNLDNTITIQFVVYGVFEAVFVTSFALILIISAAILYYLKRTHVLPRLVQNKADMYMR